MATTPPKLLRALVDYYQGGAKLYTAGNLYLESDALLLMKARGEAEVPKPAKTPRAVADKADREPQPELGGIAAEPQAQEPAAEPQSQEPAGDPAAAA